MKLFFLFIACCFFYACNTHAEPTPVDVDSTKRDGTVIQDSTSVTADTANSAEQ